MVFKLNAEHTTSLKSRDINITFDFLEVMLQAWATTLLTEKKLQPTL